MRLKLIFADSFPETFDPIVAFFARQVGTKATRKFNSEVYRRFSMLQSFPYMGPPHPDKRLAAEGYRKLVLTDTYVAVYKVIEDTVVVYGVFNGRTDYPRLLL